MDVNYEYLISSYSPFLVGVETWKILSGRLKKIVRNWRINNWSSSVLITLVVGKFCENRRVIFNGGFSILEFEDGILNK